jgi:hypothetical protein
VKMSIYPSLEDMKVDHVMQVSLSFADPDPCIEPDPF